MPQPGGKQKVGGLRMVGHGTGSRSWNLRGTQGPDSTWLSPSPHQSEAHCCLCSMPILAGNSPGGVSLRAMAWVVAHDPPGCRESSHPGASSDKPSCGAPATPADLIWAPRGRHGMENLFYAALCPSREPESEWESPWGWRLVQLHPAPAPHVSPRPTHLQASPTLLPCRACSG